MKKQFRFIGYLFAVLVGWFVIHSVVIIVDGLMDEIEDADVIVVLGNKVNEDGTLSDRLKARLDKAIELYEDHLFIESIFVSGAVGKEGHDEAVFMENYLKENGVNGGNIIVDSEGFDTYSTAFNVKDYLIENGLTSAILVTNYYHIARTELAFESFGIETYSAHAEIFEFRDPYSIFREFFAYYSYLIKDYDVNFAEKYEFGVEFIYSGRLENLRMDYDFLFEFGEPIVKRNLYHESLFEKGASKKIVEKYSLDGEVKFTVESPSNYPEGSKVYTFYEENGEKYFEALICEEYADFEYDHRIYLVEDGFVLDYFEGPCPGTNNIFYDGIIINDTFNVEGSRNLFKYDGKIGFIFEKDEKEQIFFDGKIVSSSFDRIIDKACCINPSHFVLYDNGALVFMIENGDDKFYVHLDLNKI